MRRDRSEMRIAVGRAYIKLDSAAIAQQFLVGFPLMRVIEHHDGVHLAPARQFAQRVIHEQSAAVSWRTNRDRARRRVPAAAPGWTEAAKSGRGSKPAACGGTLRNHPQLPDHAHSSGTAAARGSCRKARRMPEALVRVGEFPDHAVTIAPAKAKKKCDVSRSQPWMFFQQKSRKFFRRTDWM